MGTSTWCSRSTHLVLPFASKQNWIPSWTSFQEARHDHLLRALCSYSTWYCKNEEGESLQNMDFLTEEEYLNVMEQIPAENQYFEDSDPEKFIAKMGAECLIELLSRIDLEGPFL